MAKFKSTSAIGKPFNLNVRRFNSILCVIGRYAKIKPIMNGWASSINSDINTYLEITINLNILWTNIQRTYWRMVRYLLHIYYKIAYSTLICLSQNGIKWFLYIWISNWNKHKCTCYKFHLLNRILLSNCFCEVIGYKSKAFSNDVKHWFLIKYLNWKRHIHNWFSW